MLQRWVGTATQPHQPADGWEQAVQRSAAKQFTPHRKFFVLFSWVPGDITHLKVNCSVPRCRLGTLKPLVMVQAGWWHPIDLEILNKSMARKIRFKLKWWVFFKLQNDRGRKRHPFSTPLQSHPAQANTNLGVSTWCFFFF